MIRYTVRCRFTGDDPAVSRRWLDWLRETHIADVIVGGAVGAEIVRMTADIPTFEIRYRFATAADFARYLSEHAPSLRADGLKEFPLELGLEYSRTDGEVIFET